LQSYSLDAGETIYSIILYQLVYTDIKDKTNNLDVNPWRNKCKFTKRVQFIFRPFPIYFITLLEA